MWLDPSIEVRPSRCERIVRARSCSPRLLLHQARQSRAAKPAGGFQ
ncbi:MAG: hypothetical protein H8E20_09125 [Verrucomicrobia bacterium]|nr:hypothetical protein [Verrucomicrobiota bacterium]